MPKLFSVAVLGGLLLASTSNAFAADDSSIKGQLRTDIQQSMLDHVAANSMNGDYIIYDAVDGELLRLDFDSMHDGIVRKGDFYVACGDFYAADGTYYDLDLLVAETDGNIRVLQSIVHKKGDTKRKYHVEN